MYEWGGVDLRKPKILLVKAFLLPTPAVEPAPLALIFPNPHFQIVKIWLGSECMEHCCPSPPVEPPASKVE